METLLWALVAAAAGLLLTIVVVWWALRRFARPPQALVEHIGGLSWRQRLALVVALVRDPRIPTHVRLLIPAVLLYLALPLDIIPDFIPVLGALDDILVVVVALRIILSALPEGVLEEHLRLAEDRQVAAPCP